MVHPEDKVQVQIKLTLTNLISLVSVHFPHFLPKGLTALPQLQNVSLYQKICPHFPSNSSNAHITSLFFMTEWKRGDPDDQRVDWDCEFALVTFHFLCRFQVLGYRQHKADLSLSQIAMTAMDWLSSLLEQIRLLWHKYNSRPVQDCLASRHCPREQVRGFVLLVQRFCTICLF